MKRNALIACVFVVGAGCATTREPSSSGIPYPVEALKKNIGGTVVLNVSLDEVGTVTNVTVLEGPGFGLNEAAQAALYKFRFKPATANGKPVPVTFVYRYTFLTEE